MIVLDMEWNQPLSPDSPLAIELCTVLPFEIIQIGAVNLETGAQFKSTCCLQQYKVLSPRISKLTGITRQEVKHGEPFQAAMDRFREFCGEDPILLTWGFNDIPILRQNLSFYHLDTRITDRSYNLQIMFNQQHDPGPLVRGLSYAVDFFHLEVEDSYHDGLNDAAYTAEVAKHLDIPRGMAEYPDYLKYFEGDGDQAFLDCLRYANYTRFESFEEMLEDPRIKDTKCPHCGLLTTPTEPIYPESGRMVWTCKCPTHGEYLIRVSFKRNRDDSMRASKVTFVMDDAHRAQYKKAQEKAAGPERPSLPPSSCILMPTAARSSTRP
jgi:inhibitor of KinA sporulation pathway (predicted exonuclease)